MAGDVRIPRRIAWGFAAALLLRTPSAVAAADCGPTPYDCALVHVGAHDFAAALRDLDAQLAATPRDLKALNLYGIALTGAGRRDAANERFRSALAIDPSFHPAMRNLGVNEFDAGRLDQAQAWFEKVAALVPADEVAHVYLGEIHFRRRRPHALAERPGLDARLRPRAAPQRPHAGGTGRPCSSAGDGRRRPVRGGAGPGVGGRLRGGGACVRGRPQDVQGPLRRRLRPGADAGGGG